MKSNKMNVFLCTSIFLFALGNSTKIVAAVVDGFPDACTYANDRDPLPGHVVRLGKVQQTSNGYLFFFPDEANQQVLSTAPIAENAGIIGQEGSETLRYLIFSPTQPSYFVVAQVFVAEENREPLVTCVSPPRAQQGYSPTYFGPSYDWLDQPSFFRWLRYKKYSRWHWWRHQWYNDHFSRVRSGYWRFKHKRYHWRNLTRFRNDERWREDRDRGRYWRRHRHHNHEDRRDRRERRIGDFRRTNRRIDENRNRVRSVTQSLRPRVLGRRPGRNESQKTLITRNLPRTTAGIRSENSAFRRNMVKRQSTGSRPTMFQFRRLKQTQKETNRIQNRRARSVEQNVKRSTKQFTSLRRSNRRR